MEVSPFFGLGDARTGKFRLIKLLCTGAGALKTLLPGRRVCAVQDLFVKQKLTILSYPAHFPTVLNFQAMLVFLRKELYNKNHYHMEWIA